jgi:hypothetical protein
LKEIREEDDRRREEKKRRGQQTQNFLRLGKLIPH